MDLFGLGGHLSGIDQYLDRMDKATKIMERVNSLEALKGEPLNNFMGMFDVLVEAARNDLDAYVKEQKKKSAEKDDGEKNPPPKPNPPRIIPKNL